MREAWTSSAAKVKVFFKDVNQAWEIESPNRHSGSVTVEPQVASLLRLWQENPTVTSRLRTLLNVNIPEGTEEPALKQEKLRARIAGFDGDTAILELMSNGVQYFTQKVPPNSSPPREQFYRQRQEILEEIFLPVEDEVAWDDESIASGLDSLAAVEYHRRRDICAVKASLGSDVAAELGTSNTGIEPEALCRLDTEATDLYRIVYLGLRIFVSFATGFRTFGKVLTKLTCCHPPSRRPSPPKRAKKLHRPSRCP